IYITGKQAGETSLYAVDGNDKILLSRKITVSHNLSRLRAMLNDFLPDSAIDVRSLDGAIILSGSVRTASDSEDARQIASRMVKDPANLLNKLSITAPNQVNLRVRIAEVSRSVIKEFGINWTTMFKSGGFLFGLATGAPFLAGATAFQAAERASAITRPNGANTLSSSFVNQNVDVNGLIDAMDDEGLVTILAEPNLTAISGETATFLAGGEFPIIVPDDGKVTIEFKQFGVSLAFTPTLLGGKRINLKVRPEVSQLSAAGAVSIQGFSIPSLTTRRAETTVELGSGQSFAIAGLIQNNINSNVDKFPGLGDVPMLGSLFRSNKFQRSETELVIIVTPYIVRPVSSRKLVTPIEGLTPPNDVDRILHGRTHRPSIGRTAKGPHGRGAAGLTGPVGFVLD
ncbi:MAG: type II and III secretion system protein family protein, partial [Rhodospirillales bacterium]|nr:type II and III secretion system protein family protein [Rhodospirillales bacterium]